MKFHGCGEAKMGYEVIDRWVVKEEDDPDDESRKEVQIVRQEDSDEIYVRAPYYGPSGKYGRDAPTYAVDEAVQQNLIEALEKAFPKARKLQRRKEFEETVNETDLEPGELQKLAKLAEEAGGVEELAAQVE